MTPQRRRVWVEVRLVFSSNLLWENAHGWLYDTAPLPGWRYLRAALGDVLLVSAGAAVACPWRRRSASSHVLASMTVLTVLAVGVELQALRRQRWGYRRSMPTLGPVGISPLVQLPITGLASAWVARRLVDKAGAQS